MSCFVVAFAAGGTAETPSAISSDGPLASQKSNQLSFPTAADSPPTASEPVTYSGTTNCKGMFVKVSFVKHPDGYIRSFKAEHGCKGEDVAATWSPGSDIEVKSNGTFAHDDGNGNSVSGKITKKGAKGKFAGGVAINCKKSNKFRKMCMTWRVTTE